MVQYIETLIGIQYIRFSVVSAGQYRELYTVRPVRLIVSYVLQAKQYISLCIVRRQTACGVTYSEGSTVYRMVCNEGNMI